MDQLIFVGSNSRPVALHRDTGKLTWQWQNPQGSGNVKLLLDGDRLIVSVVGYTHCLDPVTGKEVWFNALSGFRTGAATTLHAT
jgi:hypothetical protein